MDSLPPNSGDPIAANTDPANAPRYKPIGNSSGGLGNDNYKKPWYKQPKILAAVVVLLLLVTTASAYRKP
jgi:hypothetical protein